MQVLWRMHPEHGRPMHFVDLAERQQATRKTNSNWSLYQRDDCQLCDEAIAVLAQAGMPEFTSVWIDDDAQLEAEYGSRVPVLRDTERGRELDWPFDAERIKVFLSSAGSVETSGHPTGE